MHESDGARVTPRRRSVWLCRVPSPRVSARCFFLSFFLFFCARSRLFFFFFLQPFPHPLAGSIPLLRSSKFVMDLCILKIYS